jgi:hypothetical protein
MEFVCCVVSFEKKEEQTTREGLYIHRQYIFVISRLRLIPCHFIIGSNMPTSVSSCRFHDFIVERT